MTADEAESARPARRRRRRSGAPQGEPPQSAPPEGASVPTSKRAAPKRTTPAPPAPKQSTKAASDAGRTTSPLHGRRPRDPSERAMRDLAGTGSSQLSVSAALRARDVNRPTDEDFAQAERDVVIVRRNWHPPR